MITAGELLTRVLRARGVDATYGVRLPGVGVTEVEAAVAPVMAAAHRRVHGRAAAVSDGDGLRWAEGPTVVVTDSAGVAAAVDAGSVRLDLDLSAPAPDVVPVAAPPADRWLAVDPDIVSALAAARSPAALIGPGVVAEGAVPGLHAVATALSIGVLNTWGAKGVFDWRSRHHFATVGLQARDFQLGGLASADLLLTSGLDPLEAPAGLWRLAPVVDVRPGALGPLAQEISRPRVELDLPPLRTGLAAVTQDGWTRTAAPLAPTRVTLHYGLVFGAGGLVAADPGTAGYWVARTFSTTELGSAIVPAGRGEHSFAVACALVARLRRPGRPVLAVADDASGAESLLACGAPCRRHPRRGVGARRPRARCRRPRGAPPADGRRGALGPRADRHRDVPIRQDGRRGRSGDRVGWPVNLSFLLTEHPFGDDEPLLHGPRHSVTAGEARSGARAVADELVASGVGPGHAVAVRLPNGPEAVVAMIGVWLADCVFVPVNHRAPARELARVEELLAPAAVIDGEGLSSRPGSRTYEPGTAFVLWTSGTTGAPKAILHTHDAYIELLDRVLGPPPRRRAGPTRAGGRRRTSSRSPWRSTPASTTCCSVSGRRAAIVIMDRFETAEFAELVRRFGIRSTVLPPAAIADAHRRPRRHRPRSAPVRAQHHCAAVAAAGPPVHEPSSPSSCSTATARPRSAKSIGWTAADAKEHPDKVGAAGRPHAGVDIKIVDCRRPAVGPAPPERRPCSRYAGGDRLDDRVDADGFVDTGDLARVDDDGFVWIEGRAGDVINRGGNKIFPGDVEEVLRLVPGGHRRGRGWGAGQPPRRGARRLRHRRADRAPTPSKRLCREHLVPYKVPVAFHLVDALPRNEVGKLLRGELVARAAKED